MRPCRAFDADFRSIPDAQGIPRIDGFTTNANTSFHHKNKHTFIYVVEAITHRLRLFVISE